MLFFFLNCNYPCEKINMKKVQKSNEKNYGSAYNQNIFEMEVISPYHLETGGY